MSEPVWRRDFPYTSAGEEQVTRREFARYLALASGGFAFATLGAAAWAQLRVPPRGAPTPIVALSELAVGSTYLFRYPRQEDPAILLRLATDELRAFSQKCTHLGCVVYHEREHARLACPCHEGFFDEDSGRVLAGPPSRPLERIEVEVRDDTVWALGMAPEEET